MNYRFQNLLGAPYRGGNVVLSKNKLLISPVGNRVSVTDLLKSETITLPIQSSADIRLIDASPDGVFLLTIDDNNRCLFINLTRRCVLHRMTFKEAVNAAKFSPDGRYIAVAEGKKVKIWQTPGFKREFFPFNLLKTLVGSNDRITSLNWSPNSDYLLVGSKDLVVRLFYFDGEKQSKEEKKRRDNFGKPFLFLGHRDAVVGAFFGVDKKTGKVDKAYSLSRDGALFSWKCTFIDVDGAEKTIDSDPESPGTPGQNGESENKINLGKRKDFDGKGEEFDAQNGVFLHKMKWALVKKDFFNQANAKLTACHYHMGLDMVVVGFSNGVFGLYQMPDFVCLHLLSISSEKISVALFSDLGKWLTFGCAKLGQLLVWDWKDEKYEFKQQGHYFDVNCLAYSPDSQMLATGADDNKIKVWTVASGSCHITFSKHTNAVTALHFTSNNHCLLSASLDGTVNAWDLLRYRNFRTFVSPTPNQFVSLAADQSGEVICAGTLDSFEIFVWSMKTGKLLDILSGHEGPVHGLMFSPTTATLASSSWDKTIRLWDIFEGRGSIEKFDHTHDVLSLVYRPDGKQLACSTLDGQIHFWDPLQGLEMYTIEGRRDISGGRLMTDRKSAANSTAGKCFTTLCYSADGLYIFAAGNSKYICMYDVADQVLMKKFELTFNESLDGVADFLNSRNMTDAGPLNLIDDDNSDVEEGVNKQTRTKMSYDLPGSVPNLGRPTIRTKCLRMAPTGRSWAAATTEGVMLYSMDQSVMLDPTDLDIDVTPEAVDAALKDGQMERALILSLRMNEDALIKKCILAVSPVDIPSVASLVPFKYLKRLIEAFADLLEKCPHLEFIMRWSQEICKAHGNSIQRNSINLLPALKSLQKAITKLHQDLADTCSSNEYMLRYLCSVRTTT